MYESFFSLQRRSFSATPDPSCFFPAESVQTILDEVVVCLERGAGIAVVSAPPGLGKTLLCERVKQELGPQFVSVLLRHGNLAAPSALLQTLLAELNVPSTSTSEQELRRQLTGTLAKLRQRQEALVVLCDEAHQLSDALLEELRTLTDHADHGVTWVRVLLSGQLDLEDKLAQSSLAALNQRLRSHVVLPALSAQESLEYIDHRITWAGGRTEELFHPEALLAIVDAADGVPRCLNQLCDHVLLLAYAAEERPAGPDLVQAALSDLQHLPLTWNMRASRDAAEIDPPPVSQPPEEPAVRFGEHLSTWESTPTFGGSPSGEVRELGNDETEEDPAGVWEFGLDEESSVSEIPPATSYKVETRLDRFVAPSFKEAPDVFSTDEEEPVVDRYAAIDGGWLDDRPIPEPVVNAPMSAEVMDMHDDITIAAPAVLAERPTIYASPAEPVSPPYAKFFTAVAVQEDPELQLQDDVIELATTVREAVHSRIDSPVCYESETPALAESAAMPGSSSRPFRNLFTRLRRKQKGLE